MTVSLADSDDLPMSVILADVNPREPIHPEATSSTNNVFDTRRPTLSNIEAGAMKRPSPSSTLTKIATPASSPKGSQAGSRTGICRIAHRLTRFGWDAALLFGVRWPCVFRE